MTIRNLDALLAPRSVALIGATPREGAVGRMIAKNLLAGGFKGPVMLVNPHHARLFDQPCYPTIAALPSAPDLAVVATPPPTVPGVVAELAGRGTRAVVAITAGLGAVERQALLDASRPHLVRILGPNSIGMQLPPIGLDASFAHLMPAKGDLAFLSQSGALVTAVIDWAAARHIGFSHVLSLGDMLDVDFGDLLDYLAADTRSRAILLYMEAVTHAPKFLTAARRAARVKPVIVIKSGRNAAAARAAASHTGRLAGNDAAYEAAFRRAGVLRVSELRDLFEAAEMLSRTPPLAGERLMIVTNGGGAGVLATDQLADRRGTLAELSPATRDALDRLLPAAWSRANPVDVIGDASPERYSAALAQVLSDPACDALLAMNCPTALASSTEIARRVVSTWKAAPLAKPLLTSWLGEPAAREARAMFAREGIATFETPGSAVRGFMQLVEYTRAQDELMRTPPAMPAGSETDLPAARAVIERALAAGRTMLSEAEGKAIVAAAGIPVAASIEVPDPAAAATAARPLILAHGSVVLKILSDDLTHKSDVGGVELGLPSAEAVEVAAVAMLDRVRQRRPDAHVRGFTVSPMIRRARAHELILGVTVDEAFGPLIMFGAGGTAVEVLADTSLALPPLDLQLARDLIARTRVARLLAGYRDRKPADVGAIAEALVRLSALVCALPEIRELDINPLFADEAGVIAVDARVKIADERVSPRPALAIKPYPTEWIGEIELPTLGPLVIRPIRPDDEVLYDRFLAHVKPEDLRMRLLAPQKHLSHKFLARMTQIDYAREIAFVALDKTSGNLLGVSRFAADPDYVRAEYAILTRSDLKGRGLGWALMQRLIAYARKTGIQILHGTVLAENETMLRMCRELGFKVRPEPDEPALRSVELDLG